MSKYKAGGSPAIEYQLELSTKEKIVEQIIKELTPVVISAAGIVITALAGWIASLLSRKLGVDKEVAQKAIEEFNRKAMHLAAQTAAKLAVERGMVSQQAVDFILNYMKESTPEALLELMPTKKVLRDIAESKLADAMKAAAPAVAAVPFEIVDGRVDLAGDIDSKINDALGKALAKAGVNPPTIRNR